MSRLLPEAGAIVLEANGTPTPRQAIIEETVRLCVQVYKDQLRAIVLTGSVARDEGTFITDGDRTTLLGDAEFFAVFRDREITPGAADLRVIEDKIAQRLDARAITASVSVNAVHGRYLQNVPPSIFGYELRQCGQVVQGEPDILHLVPAFSPAAIPLEDAWRLLANRLVEQLEGFDELASGCPMLSRETYYRTIKLYLDLGTSLLVFTGGYAPTYAERLEALSHLRPQPGPGRGLATDALVADITAATRWKLDATRPAPPSSRAFWERAIEHAEHLWRWQLEQLTGLGDEQTDKQLLGAWIARQPVVARLRGWAYVARSHGWQRSLMRAPQWIGSALKGSPRYLVYATAAPLVFALRRAGGSPQVKTDGPEHALPLATATSRTIDTRALARDILANYRHFLTGTRA